MSKEYLSFDVKTGMKNIIGRELITDDFIAIYELVKNSYDALADHVKITFLQDEIIIADNGKGMSDKDLKGKWFAVAYSAKKDGTEDDGNKRDSHLNNLRSRRFYAGAKGVGRFSCDRLGNKLELVTKKRGTDETYEIRIDWQDFELNAKQSFGDIQIPMERGKVGIDFKGTNSHGTVLKIKELNSIWNENKLLDLKRSLEKLINPFSEKSDFKIQIVGHNVNGVINNTILRVLDIKTTQVNVVATSNIIKTKLIDRGTLIYDIEEPNLSSGLIDNLDITLYYLNRSAKVQFGKIMDIEPVNYGNVFLFKNGFRVQPYGNVGDDSWGLDRNKTQGYGRYLGTRELFGKVELITENFDEFKEVSSRDGGLVETSGKKVLFELFEDKALKRLERYVSGVLWGEAFRRKNYFVNDEIAEQVRSNLKDDKDKDTFDDVKSNIGSKIDFVNLIKSLSDDSNIKIVAYNNDLLNLVNEQLTLVQPKFIHELAKIAENTNDVTLLAQIKLTEENFNRILLEKEEAEQKAIDEEKRRVKAEEERRIAQEARKVAEEKAKAAEEAQFLAELRAKEHELKLREEEVKRKEAEQIAKEEEERRILADRQKAQAIKEKHEEVAIANLKTEFYRKQSSPETDALIHHVKNNNLQIKSAATNILTELNKENANYAQLKNTIIEHIYRIIQYNEKSLKATDLILKSDLDKADAQRINLPSFTSGYFTETSYGVNIHPSIAAAKFEIIGSKLDLALVYDNLIDNSKKWGAKNVWVVLKVENNSCTCNFYDDGRGLDKTFVGNPKEIFLFKKTAKDDGTGFGLYLVRESLKKMKASIEIDNPINGKGMNFKITFK